MRHHRQLLVAQTRRRRILQNLLALGRKSRLFRHPTLQKGLQKVNHAIVLEGTD